MGISERKKSEELNKIKRYAGLSTLRRKIHELLKGEKAYTTKIGRKRHDDYKNKKSDEKKLEKKTKKRLEKLSSKGKRKTTRTKNVESALRNAGLTEKEIKSLRGGK